jgi:DNA excision repair protein ERCC-2
VSVRELVELTCRCGDLKRGQGPRASALEGVLAHRAIQGSRGGAYRAEHRLEASIARGDVVLAVSGRADGVDTSCDPPLVEEIKTVATPLIFLHEGAHPLHFAQADAYAAMLAAETKASAIRVRVTYVHRDSLEIRAFERTRSAAELAAFLEGAAGRLIDVLDVVLARRRERDASIARLEFPYASFRPGQRELAEAAAASIARGETLLAHVPTGAGKTMALLHAAFALHREGIVALHEAVNMITRNPARAVGIADETGSLEEGKAADLVLVDDRGEVPRVVRTFVGGREVFAS